MKLCRSAILHTGAMLAAMLVTSAAHAVPFSFSNEFSGSGGTCENGTCATLDVTQDGADVDFTLSANLAEGEFITGLYGNVDPYQSAVDIIDLGSIAGTNWSSLAANEDGLKADGDGYFDWNWNYPSSGDRFVLNDFFSWTFVDVDIDDIINAISVNGPEGKNGFTFALRVQGLGENNENSGWFNALREPSTEIPTPGVLGLLGIGLLAFGLARRNRAA